MLLASELVGISSTPSLGTTRRVHLGKRETVGHNVVPGVAGVGVAQIGNGKGEGRADQVEGVHHCQGQQQPEHVCLKWTKFHKYWSPMKGSLMFQLCEVNNTDNVENDANGSNKEHEDTLHKNL